MGVVDRVGALTGQKVEGEAELVFWLNGYVAIGVGAVCWLWFDVSAGVAAILTAVVFVALLTSLFHPYAAIVAGILGSSAAAGIGGLVGASLGLRYGGTPLAWWAGLVGATSSVIVAAASYRKLVRAGLSARERAPGP